MKKPIIFILLLIPFLINILYGQKPAQDPRHMNGLRKDLIFDNESTNQLLNNNLIGNRLVNSTATSLGAFTLTPLNGDYVQEVGLKNFPNTAPTINNLERNAEGGISWIYGNLGNVEQIVKANKINGLTEIDKKIEACYFVLEKIKNELKTTNPRKDFIISKIVNDELGFTHIRYNQCHNAVPIFGNDFYLHINNKNEIYALNGLIDEANDIAELRVNYTEANGKEICKNYFEKSRKFEIPIVEQGQYSPQNPLKYGIYDANITYLKVGKCDFRLCYEVDCYPSFLEHYTCFVDANSGEVIKTINLTCAINHTQEIPIIKGCNSISSNELKNSKIDKVLAAGFTDGRGTDLLGKTQNIRVYQHTDNNFYMLWDLSNLNTQLSKLPNTPSGGAITVTANNNDLDQSTQLFHVSSSQNNWSDPSTISAHKNMEVTFGYYKSKFSRRALDNQDQSMMSVMHVTDGGRSMGNAFWNGRVMAYGDGDNTFKPLAGGLDVAGHEMTHGVVSNSANLVYQFQSGALNESFADVFGIMIDNDDFLVGEDVVKSSAGIALRDLSNPANTRVVSSQPAHMNNFQNMSANDDNGGVHINSGIPNKAAYNAIVALGRDKVEKIWYRALTNYLTRSSSFFDCRIACEKAAQDLFGATSQEFSAVGNSFGSVGIGSTGGTKPDNNVPQVSGGQSMIAFMISDGKIGYYDVAKNQAFLINNSNAVARVSTSGKCQLSVPRDGLSIWFITNDGVLAYVDLAKNQVLGFQNLKIQSSGDLWNSCISPDGNYCAIVSAYKKDPTIYIFDGTNLAKFPILIETSQNGIADQTLQYPDVISWSANMNKPRIGFDGYNELSFLGENFSWWGMYEFDILAKRYYDLVPAQSDEVSIGNINFAKINSNKIAFNVISSSNVFDTYVADFTSANSEFNLNLPNFTIAGRPIIDAERPTFSTDDRFVCLSSPENKALVFYDLTQKKPTFFSSSEAMYNPVWFMFGGKVGVNNEVAIKLKTYLVKNILNIELGEFSNKKCSFNLYNSNGGLITRFVTNSDDKLQFDCSNLASGYYFTELTCEGKKSVSKICIEK